jgi:hypothetical protein
MLFLVRLTGAPEAHVGYCYLAILTSRQHRFPGARLAKKIEVVLWVFESLRTDRKS